MNLELKYNNAAEIILDHSKTIWRIASKRYWIYILILLLMAVPLIAFGLFSPEGSTNTTTDYSRAENNGTIYQSITNYNYHLAFSVGLALLLLSLIYSLQQIRTKSLFLNKTRIYRFRLKTYSNEITISIDDKTVSYNAYAINQIISWELFSAYEIQNDVLCLFVDHPNWLAIAIDKKYISEAQFQELINFLNGRIPRKKF